MIRRYARPYAKAIMELAGTPADAQRLRDEVAAFERVRAGSQELADVMANPGVDATAKQKIVEQIAVKLGLSDLPKRFLGVLIANHRINDLGAILEAWTEMIHQALGVAIADVRVAHELSDEERRMLEGALSERFGKRVDAKVSVDRSLLGGFVARVGSEVYDASVLGQIQKFREALS